MFKKFYIILFSTALVFAAPSASSKIQSSKKEERSNSKYKKYRVKSGDTLFSIARKFKVSISEINKVNHLKSNSLIYPGDILKIPNKSYVEEAQKAVKTQKKTVYRVKRGDTLRSIARKFNMSIEELLEINNIRRKKLRPGTEINVFANKKLLKKRRRVTRVVVRKGDTLWSIAKRYNLTLRELRILNPKLRTLRRLKSGLVLNVSKEEARKLLKLSKARQSKLRGKLAKYRKVYTYSYTLRGGKSSSRGNQRIVRYAKRFLGTPYVWGASSGRAFDCSGFTQYVFKKVKGKMIPRVSRRQAYYGMYVPRHRLIGGDLVFFDTSKRRRGYVNHVGIYIGNNKFIHASSAKHRVVITSLNKPFYSQRFMWGRRVN